MRWDTRNPLQKAGAGAGQSFQDLASLMMMAQARKQEQSNFERMFSLKQGAANRSLVNDLGGPVGVDTTGHDYYTEKPGQFNVRPGLQEAGVSMPGNAGNAYNPPQADPMDEIKLKKAQVELQIAMQEYADMGKPKEPTPTAPKTDEETRKDVFNELYSPTTGMPSQGSLDSAYTHRKTGQYPPSPPEEQGFLGNLWDSIFGSDKPQSQLIQPPPADSSQTGNENQALAAKLKKAGLTADRVNWDEFKKDWPNADIEAIKRYLSGN